MTTITFGSVCSGLEAASVAWHRFGWRAAWLAEIEGFPAKLLHHHYGSGRPHHMPSPDDPDLSQEDRDARAAAIKALAYLPLVPANSTTVPPNLGDMTRIEAMVRAGQVAAPDVLCGGTPCQGFSLAGLRGSLEDARGQLTLSFVRLADAIDAARSVQRKPAAVIVWENVHGVLSTKDNAFGNFLGALAGEDSPLVPPGPGWSNAGCVFGPKRAIAWRVYDAQYFGVAQRRRRVFVVASAREGFDPAAVLLEFDGVRRDSPPSRGTQENTAGTVAGGARRSGGYSYDDIPLTAATLTATGKCDHAGNVAGQLLPVVATLDASYGRLQGCSGQDANHGHSHLIPVAFGGNNQSGPIEVATAVRAHGGPHLDFESETFLVQPALSVALRGREGGGTAELGDDLANCLRASGGGGDKPHVLAPIAFDARQDCVSSTEVFGALGSSSPQAQAVAFSCKDYGADASVELAPTMRAMGHSGSHANAGGQLAVCVTGDITHTLKAEGFDASEDGTGSGQPIVAFQDRFRGDDGRGYGRAPNMMVEQVGTLETVKQWNVATAMAVRRLTPRECERLQGFPDDHTLVPVKKISQKRADKLRALGEPVAMVDGQPWQLAADGPRYKALGNSWAVPNVVWIGNRINRALRAQILENAA